MGRWREVVVGALQRSDTWLIMGGNALPLLGVFLLGWDASTLVVLYWLETAIIGFWTIVRVLVASPDTVAPARALVSRDSGPSYGGAAMALFLVLHAGIFMGGHLFFLSTMLPGDWRLHLGSPLDFLFGFIIPSGIWLPLLGLFLVRGIMTVSEIRAGGPVVHVIIGFYARIVLLQLTIILGGFFAMAIGGTVVLALLVVLKTLADLGMNTIANRVIEAADEARRNSPG